ncbi:MAG: S1 RNA-binding domain-containing protein [Candidatus Micrarchaeota archaeon]|nr:S1 RNA-binding domain-containing protein [Candidatus Micrarchaeota archaeon]
MEDNKLPRQGSLVIAVVSKITNFGAYCKLIEYGDTEAFLPIREVSSGWIKNIREYIHDGQKLVCYVHSLDKDKGTIDISLKRVSTKDSKDKIRSYNLEKRLAALFSQVVRKEKEVKNKDELISLVIQEFGTYTNLMEAALGDTPEFGKSRLPKKVRELFVKELEQSRKQKRYYVSYIATISTYNTESGATELRSLMKEIRDTGVDLGYLGAPKYRLFAEGKDYTDAEAKISKVRGIVESKLKKGVFEIEKEKLKKEKEGIMETI